MKTRVTVLLIVVFFASASIPAQEKTTNSGAAFMQEVFAAWNSHDPDKIVGLYTEDVVYEDVSYGVISRGREELRKFAVGFIDAVPDLKLEATSTYVHNGHGRVEWVLSGTDKGLYKSGKKFSVRGASVFEMRGSKVSSNKDFYDLATIMRQVGVLPADKSS